MNPTTRLYRAAVAHVATQYAAALVSLAVALAAVGLALPL